MLPIVPVPEVSGDNRRAKCYSIVIRLHALMRCQGICSLPCSTCEPRWIPGQEICPGLSMKGGDYFCRRAPTQCAVKVIKAKNNTYEARDFL